MILKKCALYALLVVASVKGRAQIIPLGSIRTEEATRDLQLLGKIPSNYSFNNRPFVSSNKIEQDSIYKWIDPEYFAASKHFDKILHKRWFKITLLPFETTVQYNSNTPYGYNNGAFIKAKGLQQLTRAGLFVQAGPLQIQAAPEMITAQNNGYDITPAYGNSTTPNFKKIYPGQSSVSLNFNALSIGVASTNKWYGPGINNSLLMSNNAPGFARAFMGTNRPLVTPIGSFEWTLSSGWVTEDSTLQFENYALKASSKLNRRMYYNGIVLSFQPKWFSGLHVGISRAYVVSESDLNSSAFDNSGFVDKYLPVFSVLEKRSILATEDQKGRDQQASLFMRWVLPKNNFEFYAEYGWNDHAVDIRDLYMGPGHSASYLVGIKKIIPIPTQKAYFNIDLEYMRGEQLAESLVRDAGNWNYHGDLQTFTNDNQLLGSAVGPGNNSIKIATSYNLGWNRILFSIEKVQNNPQYFSVNPWTDMVYGTGADYRIKNLVISSVVKAVVQKNYGWQAGNHSNNIFASLGFKYLF